MEHHNLSGSRGWGGGEYLLIVKSSSELFTLGQAQFICPQDWRFTFRWGDKTSGESDIEPYIT